MRARSAERDMSRPWSPVSTSARGRRAHRPRAPGRAQRLQRRADRRAAASASTPSPPTAAFARSCSRARARSSAAAPTSIGCAPRSTLSDDENVADAERMSRLFRAIDAVPKPVIGRVHGAALGGGAGLAAVCDVVVAADEARLRLHRDQARHHCRPSSRRSSSRRSVLSHARALFLTGERFDAGRAFDIGLVHEVVPEELLDDAVERIAERAADRGPVGVAAAKALLADGVADAAYDDTLRDDGARDRSPARQRGGPGRPARVPRTPQAAWTA